MRSRKSEVRSQKFQTTNRKSAAILAASTILWPLFAAAGQNDYASGDQIAADFNAALTKPVQGKTQLLETLEHRLDNMLSTGELADTDRGEALLYRFHIQHQLGKYPQACRSCESYIENTRRPYVLQPMLAGYLKNFALNTSDIRLTRYHVNAKRFYYIQFLRTPPAQTEPAFYLTDVAASDSTSTVWFTLMLGFVPDGSDQFSLPPGLFYNTGGPVFRETVSVEELNRWFFDFHKAIKMLQTQLSSTVRTSLSNIEQWLNAPFGFAPGMPTRQLRVLQELNKLEQRVFGSEAAAQADMN